MEREELLNNMMKNPLYSGADKPALADAVAGSSLKTFRKGSRMCGEAPCLCYIVSGRATVRRLEGGKDVILNVLGAGDVFGAARLFGGDAEVTDVTATGSGTCLMMPQPVVERFLKADHGFTLGYIRFLSDRIRFLNRRIASFTAGDGEKAVAAYLASRCGGEGTVKIPLSMAKLASSLNISRPTLYRALSALSGRGVLERDGSDIKILSYEKLKSI